MTDTPIPPPAGPAQLPQGRGVTRRFASMRAISALILREMATRYGRSPGGYVWAVAEPLGMIIMLTLAFEALVRVPPLGNTFILFFATGYLPFQLYMSVSNNVSRAVFFSRALLFYPAVTWVDAIAARFLLAILTDLLVMMLLFFAFIAIYDITILLDIGPVMLSLCLAALLGLGVGVTNCVLFGFFPVWMNLWMILNRPLFIISGIFFLYEFVPQNVQTLLWWNPLVHITALMRKGFYPTYDAAFASPFYVLLIAVPLLFMGTLLMRRFHRDILNR